MRILFVIFWLLLVDCFDSKAQIYYEFKVEEPKNFYLKNSIYDGIMFEFRGVRIYEKEGGIFYEENFMSRKIDTFRIRKNKWEILDDNKWHNFFSYRSFKRKEPVLWKSSYLVPHEVVKIDNTSYYVYYYIIDDDYLKGKRISSTYVFFNNEEGVMKVIYENGRSYIRIWQ